MSLAVEEKKQLYDLGKKASETSNHLGDSEYNIIKSVIKDKSPLNLIETTGDELIKGLLIDYLITYGNIDFSKLWQYSIDAIRLPNYMRSAWKERSTNKLQTQKNENDYIFSLLNRLSLQNIPKPGKVRLHALDKISAYYLANDCPWSSIRSIKLCQEIIHRMQVTETDIKELLYTYEKAADDLTKINANEKLTASGRKRLWKDKLEDIVSSPLTGNSYTDELEAHSKFVDKNIYKISGLKFIIDALSPSLLDEYWGIIFTLTMCFLDDTNILIKLEACKIIQHICGKLTKHSNVIIRAEVGPIIFDSIVPVILSLPSMTPPDISRKAIKEGYKTIFSLWQISIEDERQLNLKLSMLLNDFICPSLIKVCDNTGLVSIITNVINEQFLPLAGSYRLVLRKQLLYSTLDVLSNPAIIKSDEDVLGCLEVIVHLEPCKLKNFRFDILACLLKLRKRRKRLKIDHNRQSCPVDAKINNVCLEIGFRLESDLNVKDMIGTTDT